MREISKSYVENKKSKFYGYMFEVNNEEEIEKIIEYIKKDNKKAKHVVYAYKLGNVERKHEDKEPSGSAGLPLLDIIKFKEKNNVLIVVVRYFGGVLLGRGLLTRSYRDAANKLFN